MPYRKPGTTGLPTEALYTICPVLVASHIAVHKGWLETELKEGGGIAEVPVVFARRESAFAFNDTLANQFRDGGNIPAIHARSQKGAQALARSA